MIQEKIISKLVKAGSVDKIEAPASFDGRWVNEYNSEAIFEVSGTAVSGRYTSPVSDTGEEIQGPIVGVISGDIIAFSVSWPTPAGSITSWVGQIVREDGTDRLKTLWHLVVNIPDAAEKKGLWTTIHAGADDFGRAELPSR